MHEAGQTAMVSRVVATLGDLFSDRQLIEAFGGGVRGVGSPEIDTGQNDPIAAEIVAASEYASGQKSKRYPTGSTDGYDSPGRCAPGDE